MRLGLVSPGKHAALVNNFGDREAAVELLESLGFTDITTTFLAARDRQQPWLDLHQQSPDVVAGAGDGEQLHKAVGDKPIFIDFKNKKVHGRPPCLEILMAGSF